MPLFEYKCTKCSHQFEELVFGNDTPDCPSCGAGTPDKLLSAHSVGSSSGGGGSVATPPCGMPGGMGGCGGGMCGMN